ncbi:ATP-dependent DNA ligase [Nocardioides donggukensis]|uniref:DNA ligase n=1 Tax=Nocardioides donggukensis TaxID=2774019 RepID=A0A927K399_9ACTN|nr:ATP-dependent DNA ligase [Nocardioides donggukensis]MBD8869589.1 ATP-dependent DNA ligase [Nocardioides donggukensis]
MLLNTLVEASAAVAATRSRKTKVSLLAAVLREVDVAEAALACSYLAGSLPQRRTGVGWRGLRELPDPAEVPGLTVAETDTAFSRLAATAGAGSQDARAALVRSLFGRATAAEQGWLRGLVTGELRQGALDAVVQEALAQAAGVPVAAVRRAAMLTGSTSGIAELALTEGEQGLAALRIEAGRPVLPMLAASAPDVTAAVEKLGEVPVAVDWKLDGIRIQAHRVDGEVRLVTRSLDDITHRLPEVVRVVSDLPGDRLVLDGEAIAIGPDGRPLPFQDTASRTASTDGVAITPYFFDLLLEGDHDLLDTPARERSDRLARLVPEQHLVPRRVAGSAEEARAWYDAAVGAGHEGVVLKSLDAPYAAGRRGAGWVKVKPVHTVDLVVLAVEPGSGRRTGTLSNIHLGARDATTGELVMVGKTFKGMTDEMLAWQTERFTELMTHREAHVVHVRPEQVVEIAYDGVQRSTRYPGGVALRFARVVRYRDDKTASEADTIESVRGLLQPGSPRSSR